MKLTTKMIIYVTHIANCIYVIIFTLVIFHPCQTSFIWSFSSKCKLIHVHKLHSNLHPCSGFDSRVNNYVLQIQMCAISSMCVRVSWVHMENFIIEDQFHTWTIMLSKMEGTYNMFCIREFEESEKQPFDTTATEQQKEDVYLTSCWRIYGVGVSPSIVAGLLTFLQCEFTWHPTRQSCKQYATWSLYFVFSLWIMILHIVCSDIFVARNLFDDCWDGNHIDQFFHDWWRWILTVEMLSSDKLLKKWSCRRDWFNGEVLSLHGCSKAWMWTRKKQHKSIIKCHTPHCTNCKNRFEWISWAAIWNWICNLCKISFLEGQAQNENIKVWCGRLCHFLAHMSLGVYDHIST